MRRISVFVSLVALLVSVGCSSPTAPTQGSITSARLVEDIPSTVIQVTNSPSRTVRVVYGERFPVGVHWELSKAVWEKVMDSGNWPQMQTCIGPTNTAIAGVCSTNPIMSQKGDNVFDSGTIPNTRPYNERETVQLLYMHSFVTFERQIYPDGARTSESAFNLPIDSLVAKPIAPEVAIEVETVWVRP